MAPRNLNSSSPVVYPQPSQPPSHNLAGKSHSVAPLPVCLSYPIHPGHNTQWPGAREATGCPQLKSMPKLSHTSVSVHTDSDPQVSSTAPLPCFRLSPRHVLCPLEAMRLFEGVKAICLQPPCTPLSVPNSYLSLMSLPCL